MKRVKINLLIILMLLVFGVAAWAAGGAEGEMEAEESEPITLKWGHAQPVGHPSNVAMNEIAEEVAELTNGQVTIEVFPASQLGNAKDMIEGTLIGTQDLAYDGPGVMSQFLPKISVLEAPFLYDDYDHLKRVANSDAAQELFDELRESRGIRILDVWYYGVRHVTTKGVVIDSLDDFDGVKLRVPEIPLYLDTMRALGVETTPMPFGELYLALQTGLVSGQENPLSVIDAGKLYEVQDNISLTGHITNLQFVMISESSWQKLTGEQQTILLDAIRSGGQRQDDTILGQEGSLLDTFQDRGMTVHDIDRQALRDAVSTVYDQYASSTWGDELLDSITAVD